MMNNTDLERAVPTIADAKSANMRGLDDGLDPWSLPSLENLHLKEMNESAIGISKLEIPSRSLFQPSWTVWNPQNPPRLTIWTVVLYAWVCTTSVAILYYNQPILAKLADEFDVDASTVSRIPTAMQAGSATGLALICPAGDIMRRRSLIITLLTLTMCSWFGLCFATNFTVFTILSFLVALTALVTQILLPLVGDISAPSRRTIHLSIVGSGITLGILLGRLTSGLIVSHLPWRTVYYFSLVTQLTSILLIYLFMPDYPATNPNLSYPRALFTTLTLPFHHPPILQTTLVLLFLASTHANFWTYITFLLSDTYALKTEAIGLFSLLALPGAALNPLLTSLLQNRLHPALAAVMAASLILLAITIGTTLGTLSLAAPIVQATLHDAAFSFLQIVARDVAYAVDDKARGRINAVLTVGIFVGNLLGTGVGGVVYPLLGWKGNGGVVLGSAAVGWGFALARGPREKGWWGWKGGWGVGRVGEEGRKEDVGKERKGCCSGGYLRSSRKF